MTVQSEGEISSVSSFVSASVPVFVSAALTIVCVCVSALPAIQVDTHAHCGKQTGLMLQQYHGYTIRIYRERGRYNCKLGVCVCLIKRLA